MRGLRGLRVAGMGECVREGGDEREWGSGNEGQRRGEEWGKREAPSKRW
jgi:hypothetical protein